MLKMWVMSFKQAEIQISVWVFCCCDLCVAHLSKHNTTKPHPPLPLFTVNEYVFMVQARGIQIRENMKNIGVQVLEQVVRGTYNINGTGKSVHTDTSRCRDTKC